MKAVYAGDVLVQTMHQRCQPAHIGAALDGFPIGKLQFKLASFSVAENPVRKRPGMLDDRLVFHEPGDEPETVQRAEYLVAAGRGVLRFLPIGPDLGESPL